MLGVHAQYGRLLTPADEGRDQNKVAVLERRPSARALRSRSPIRNCTISSTAIRPRSDCAARVPHPARRFGAARPEILSTTRFTDNQLQQRRSNFLPALGRLAPGATVESAQRELNGLFNDIVTTYPQLRGEGIRVVPLTADASASVKTPLLLVFGAVLMVLPHRRHEWVASLSFRARSAPRAGNQQSVRTMATTGRMRPVLFESLLLTAIVVFGRHSHGWASRRSAHSPRHGCRNSPGSRSISA